MAGDTNKHGCVSRKDKLKKKYILCGNLEFAGCESLPIFKFQSSDFSKFLLGHDYINESSHLIKSYLCERDTNRYIMHLDLNLRI